MKALLDAAAAHEQQAKNNPPDPSEQPDGDDSSGFAIRTPDEQALVAWSFLATGMGGLNLAGLPLVVELLGVTDIEGLLWRLHSIKTHKPPKADDDDTEAGPAFADPDDD